MIEIRLISNFFLREYSFGLFFFANFNGVDKTPSNLPDHIC